MGEDFKWLLMDSCGAMAMVAVGCGEEVLGTETVVGRAFSAEWPGVVRRLVAEAGWAVGEVEVVGVVNGPGSFTGVRVGLAAAKGLCEAVGTRLVAVSRLEVLGELAVLDAGRGEFYVRDGGEERLAGLDELVALVVGREVVTADVRVAEVVAAKVVELEAVSAVGILLERVKVGAFDDVAAVDANYVRGEHDIYARKPVAK